MDRKDLESLASVHLDRGLASLVEARATEPKLEEPIQ